MKLSTVIVTIVVLLVLSLLYIIAPALTSNTGGRDFFAYWSAAYLLSQGRDFADDANLLEVEREHTGWTGDVVIKTWNPPWVLAWLLPLTLLKFQHAARLWFIINLFLLYVGIAFYWRMKTTSFPGPVGERPCSVARILRGIPRSWQMHLIRWWWERTARQATSPTTILAPVSTRGTTVRSASEKTIGVARIKESSKRGG